MTANAPTSEVIREAVMLAIRAPSLHNSQPWRWVAEGATLQLWAELCRAMTATDHTGRELTLSCGAVLDHLRVAMAAAGWESATERFPDSGNSNHLATLEFRPLGAVDGGTAAAGRCDPSAPHRPFTVRCASRMACLVVRCCAAR